MPNTDDGQATHPDPGQMGAQIPTGGMTSATNAGENFWKTAKNIRLRRIRKWVRFEIIAYLGIMSSWFLGLGLQMVLFTYLIVDKLGLENGFYLGVANLALAGPSLIFLLLGGVVAEKADGRKLLITLHLCASIPPLLLVIALQTDTLNLWWMIAYGLTMGTVGAFMMPARDSIVSTIVDRRRRVGSRLTLQLGVTLATMAQFLAQIAGLILAGYADKATTMPGWLGGFSVGPIPTETLLCLQTFGLAFGAFCAAFMARNRNVITETKGIKAAKDNIIEGINAVRADSILLGMTILMLGVGFFVIGAFLVVLPVFNKKIYLLGPDGLRDMFVTFWMGAFVASVALTVRKRIERPGRLLLLANLFGAAIILLMLLPPPHEWFLVILFLWGMAGGISISMSRSIVQGAASKQQLARVMSIYQLGSMAGAPFGAVILGFITAALGDRPELVSLVVATGMIAVVGWITLSTPIWGMKVPHSKAT